MKYQLELPTSRYVALSIVTLGFYFFIFQSKVNKIVKYMALVEDYKRIYNAMSYSIGYLIIGIAMIVGNFELFGYLGFISIAYALLNRYLWIKHVRNAIAYHMKKTCLVEYKPNFWLSLLFPGIYLTWTINHLYDDL